jgi:hypothetical protein
VSHQVGRLLFALAVGAVVAFLAYGWITDPEGRAERVAEETAVLAAREILIDRLEVEELQVVDPLAPQRKVGKVYVYREAPGWAVSGYYRRDEQDRWHPYLLTLSEDHSLHRLKVQDRELLQRAATDSRLDVIP